MACAALCLPPAAIGKSALAGLIAATQRPEAFDPGRVEAVYRETVLSGDGIDRAVARLEAFARNPGLGPAARAGLHLAIAHLQWRDGGIEDAVASSDRALAAAPTPDALLLKARLLDAGGDAHAAREWYRRAAEGFGGGEEQWRIRMRLAMMYVSKSNVQSLEQLAAQRDQEYRNQAAVVLALLGRPDRAIALFRPRPEAGEPFRQHLRLAEWALQAGEHDRARTQAWQAYAQAGVRLDGRYALALLSESYREAGELDGLLADLAERDPGDGELLRLRVETLIETGEHAQAIALYEQLQGGEAGIHERGRLLALYEAAGDRGAMVREYRRMMEAEPDRVQWYDGLAAHYLNRADNDGALAVWRTLEARNPGRADVIVEAAGLMRQTGFRDEGIAMVERHLAAHGPDAGALLFLFDAWRDEGQDDKALEALIRLEAHLPANAAEQRDLADAYERLSRPEEAVRVFETIRVSQDGLGYDEKMRLAWLYGVVNRKPDALDLWQEIWVAAESPARRSFAEGQMLLLASQLTALGDMAVELEEMLMAGKATRNHLQLLVRIYTEVGDKLSATESIDAYAEDLGENEIGRQELLARVFLLLKDYPAHDRALRRLYVIDPANRIDHIKRIIINLLTFDLATESGERFEEINRWIGELRRFDAEAATGEFEAGIYWKAGLHDQAIASYRRALVEQPENSDNLLLLADVLKRNNRTDEALAILQFFAEHAVEDNDFVVAVDGILSLIGTTRFFRPPDPAVRNKLDWTRRVILERIAGHADKFYLYELLSDIAREKGDTEGSFVALENALAEAGLRRPAILRELLTLATPNAGFGGFRTGAGDIERQLRHGRRLVGLRQFLPPEVYIDIGRSLLAKDDVAGAERAFAMINDITGMIDVNRTMAEIFEEEGFHRKSRDYYNRAFNVNRDSLDLLHKTAFLYEADGREEVAFRSYLQAIGGLLRRQKAVLAAAAPPVDPNSRQSQMGQQADTTVSRGFREHYASLEQGLLLTWPEDADRSAQAVAELRTFFEDELGSALNRAGDDKLSLTRYARLDRVARLIRRIGFYLEDSELAQYADLRLLEHFADDEEFARQLDKHYGDAGYPRPFIAGTGDTHPGKTGVPTLKSAQAAGLTATPLRRQVALAGGRGDFETQVQLLRMTGAGEELEALLGERIEDGHYRDGLGYAMAFLEERRFRRLALAVAPKLLDDRTELLKLIGLDAELFLSAEDAAGGPLVPKDKLITLLMSREAEELAQRPFTDTSGYWDYFRKRESIDNQIRLLRTAFERAAVRKFFLFDLIGAFQDLLREELSASQRRELVDTVLVYLSKQDTNNVYMHYFLVRLVLVFDARPQNREVLYRVAEYIGERWPTLPSTRPLLEAVYAERIEEAFREYVLVCDDQPRFPYFSYATAIKDVLAGPRSRLLEELESGRSLDLKLAKAAYQMEHSQYGREPYLDLPAARHQLRQLAVVMENLLQLDPENDSVRLDLIDTRLRLGQFRRAEQAIASEYRATPDNNFWRIAYFLFLKSQQRFSEALGVARDGGANLLDPLLRQQSVNGVLSKRNRSSRASIIRGLQRAAALASPALTYDQPGRGPSPTDAAVQRLREALVTGDHESGRNALREAWRGLMAPSSKPDAPRPGSLPLPYVARSLLHSPLEDVEIQGAPSLAVIDPSSHEEADDGPERSKPRMLFDAVAQTSYGATELNAFLRAAPDETRKVFLDLYKYLAKASRTNSADDTGFRELSARLQAREIDDHDFTLWMVLRDELKMDFDPNNMEAFAQRAAAMTDPSSFQLLLAARVFAVAGAAEQAVEYYMMLAARRIRHSEYAGGEGIIRSVSLIPEAHNDLPSLVDEVEERLPVEAAREFVAAVLQIARPTKTIPGSEPLFHAFALSLLEKVYPPKDLPAQANRLFPGILERPDSLVGTGGPKAIELVRVFARSGDLRRAIRLLGDIVRSPDNVVVSNLFFLPNRVSGNIRDLTILKFLYGIRTLGATGTWDRQKATGSLELLTRRERIFPRYKQDWPGAQDWTRLATDALLNWLEDGTLDTEVAVQLLVAIERSSSDPGASGDSDRDAAWLERVVKAIDASGRPLNATSLILLESMARAGESSIPFRWVAEVVKNAGLPWRQQLDLLRMYAESPAAARLLRLFRENGLDKGLAVPSQLLAMAEETGDVSYAKELRQRIKREEAAERTLLADEDEPVQSTALGAT